MERINNLGRSVQIDEARKETRHKHLHDYRCSTLLFAGLHDSDGHENTVDARHNGSLGILEGSVETVAAANERVSPAERQDAHVGIVDGASGDDVRIAGSDRGPREGAAPAASLGTLPSTHCSETPDRT